MPSFSACCAHDHDCQEADCGAAWSLHDHIDLPRVCCLNEATAGSCKGVFKPWAQRLDLSQPPLCSNEDDPELLVHVPFTGDIKVKAICVIGGTDGTAPSQVKAFINRDDIDFAIAAELPPTQQWDLQPNLDGTIEYPTQPAKFSGVHSIDLYFPANFAADHTAIHFIGFKGEFTERKREPVVTVYEARALPGDHKLPGQENLPSELV